jgi:hypothetical protein
MIIALCVISGCVTFITSYALEKGFSKASEIYIKKTQSPEDLERIAKIKAIFASIEKFASEDPVQKEYTLLLKSSLINDLEKASGERLKEVERITLNILLSYHKNSAIAA